MDNRDKASRLEEGIKNIEKMILRSSAMVYDLNTPLVSSSFT